MHIDERLCLAGHEWVQEAARVVVFARLVLLLWTNVDRPPDWSEDLQVLVEDICDLTAGAGKHRFRISWVRLHVDSLERMVELGVAECDVVDAVV